ncbi:squalene--hopene cyclase [Bacillus sp. CECT 9360]|uniref:squalene--hopene cyclase n=1 Tax=Bacillus sp. CECT 9360 TaxID=2845821 RepID=UPI001E284767|nr:squalene--hopene cyclase [Bacillus sp. CECT 9360]CAH0344092.1 Sporulenol synthase [Bacillus sp. CECT 9360]
MLEVQQDIDRIVGILKKEQSTDGSWNYPFETGVITDAYMIILLKVLEIENEALITSLVERLESKQEANGAWKSFADEKDGNLSLTIEVYYAILFSGLRNKNDGNLRKARTFIRSKGGIRKASMYTKFMLAMTGQYSWPVIFPIPLEVVLLPPSSIISIYDLSVFGRSNLLPILLLGHKKFQIKFASTPSIEDLYTSKYNRNEEQPWEELRSDENRRFASTVEKAVKSLLGFPWYLRSMATDAVRRYLFDRLEADGTLYNYFSSTFYMIFALLSLGYSKKDATITKAVEGLTTMSCQINGHTHIQYTTANVWNTSLISYALQESGIPMDDETVLGANRYLLSRQQYKYGDWIIHNPHTLPGGWGFSDKNTINPDVDDTTASLRALFRYLQTTPDKQDAWNRGLSYTFSMQNDDGGYPAFERNVDNKLLHLLPVEGAEYILTDPSTPDLTGRTIEFLGNYANLKLPDKRIKRAVKQLLSKQKQNGSWYGRWGICYLYGTWSALTGLMATGFPANDDAVKKASEWLKSIQNQDGGWGESCYSDIKKTYVPLGTSTLTQTAWAVDALIAISPKPTSEIEKGISYLKKRSEQSNWTSSYPAGQGMAGFFYIHYHSYEYIYPLLCLSHYNAKYG